MLSLRHHSGTTLWHHSGTSAALIKAALNSVIRMQISFLALYYGAILALDYAK
jgi:hypothetical protein